MLKLFTHSLGRAESASDRDHKKSKSQVKKKGNHKSQVKRGTKAKVSPDVSLTSNDFVVRIVHKGGQQEVYQRALPASKLMRKYPGMCVASPQVFKDPHQSVLGPDQVLLLGHKYIMISPRDVHKLKRKHAQQGEDEENNGPAMQELSPAEEVTRYFPCGHQTRESSNKASNEANGAQGQEMVETKKSLSPHGGIEELQGGGPAQEPHGYAKPYFSSPKDKSIKHTRRRKGIKNKPFVPPLPKNRVYRVFDWQPRLPTIQELSP
ncbi:hypothetical protein HN51_069209 [Arachis hypogaea]|uniref:uncharacterized protein LOC110271835 n=1 Tax=Arachis ipaensis TaxID=130454 RepID=UPI000A2B538B|nr:uncharacterized protein LOC110271835 [Arachis ipaensis]XP_025654196.1 uncharacterized protein LOC112749957 [Arachis hypogaea]QHO11427.1 uncharacterized protein DS421_15g497990 [Arachis hypogaea]